MAADNPRQAITHDDIGAPSPQSSQGKSQGASSCAAIASPEEGIGCAANATTGLKANAAASSMPKAIRKNFAKRRMVTNLVYHLPLVRRLTLEKVKTPGIVTHSRSFGTGGTARE